MLLQGLGRATQARQAIFSLSAPLRRPTIVGFLEPGLFTLAGGRFDFSRERLFGFSFLACRMRRAMGQGLMLK